MRSSVTLSLLLLALVACTVSCSTSGTAPQADAAATARRATLFEGARLIVGDRSAPIDSASFLVEGNRFVRVGKAGEIPLSSRVLTCATSRRGWLRSAPRSERPAGLTDPMLGALKCPSFLEQWGEAFERRKTTPPSTGGLGVENVAKFHNAGVRIYSPDCNPIEQAFAKLKAFLRAARLRTFDQVCDLMRSAFALFLPDECANYVRHSGYRVAT